MLFAATQRVPANPQHAARGCARHWMSNSVLVNHELFSFLHVFMNGVRFRMIVPLILFPWLPHKVELFLCFPAF